MRVLGEELEERFGPAYVLNPLMKLQGPDPGLGSLGSKVEYIVHSHQECLYSWRLTASQSS